jgi:N-ethylmaleimide reductase
MTEKVSNTEKLFTPLNVGALPLLHRVVMPAMARRRAAPPGGVPTSMMVQYYAQRATPGGLIVCEPAAIGPGLGDGTSAGLYSAEQVNHWRKVTDAVHACGGIVVAQLCQGPLAPLYDQDDMDSTLDAYRNAAENAGDAGFDGVELLGLEGFEGVEGRTSLLEAVAQTLIGVWGALRVGVCLSPSNVYFAAVLQGRPVEACWAALGQSVARLGQAKMAYLHLVRPPLMGIGKVGAQEVCVAWEQSLRTAFGGAVILAGDHSAMQARALLDEDMADAVAFGLPFVANPDLLQRLRTGAALAAVRSEGLHIGGEVGYTDYPSSAAFLAQANGGEDALP